MKIITISSLSHGIQNVFVDDSDFDEVSRIPWHLSKPSKTLYAANSSVGSMHRYLMRPVLSNLDVDHLDHNGLNNQRSNLRICSRSVNMQNLPIRGSSKFKGVSVHSKHETYVSRIKCRRKSYWCGSFPKTPCGEILAALSYDVKALELFGESAVLNFK